MASVCERVLENVLYELLNELCWVLDQSMSNVQGTQAASVACIAVSCFSDMSRRPGKRKDQKSRRSV